MRRARMGVPMLFLLTLMCFAVQTLMMPGRAEPYPGLFQPGFIGSPMKNGFLYREEPRATAITLSGECIQVPVNNIVTDTNNDQATVRSGLTETAVANAPATVAWLARRLRIILPDRTVVRMEIDWVEVRYHLLSKRREVIKVDRSVIVTL
jgi:hypothetical protein